MTQEGDASSRLIGTVLAGRYRILEKLGEGAMGAVYLGEHLKIGRRDAIKVLREGLARDSEAIARFMRGARNVSAVRHPNVCAIYDFSDTEDGLQFLAMEYIAGPSLRDVLAREPPRLPIERALHIARQVASALDAAHDVGIVHRDLKPGNIMLMRGRDGRDLVKVVDFDIAKGPETGGEEVTRMGFVVGTPEYMSPEQLMAEPLDGRSDVYSLGLVLFRMLTGTLPFRADNPQDVMIQRLTTAPLTLEQAAPGLAFPDRLNALIDASLQRRPADRIASAEAFEKEVAALMGGAPPEGIVKAASVAAPGATTVTPQRAEVPETRVAPPPSTPTADAQRGVIASPPPARRKLPVPILAAAVLVLAAGSVGAYMAFGPDRGVDPLAAGGEATDPGSSPGVPSPVDSQGAGNAGDSAGRGQPPNRPADSTDSRPDPVTPPDPSPPIGSGIRVAADQVNAVLLQQLDLLVAGPPASHTVDAVIDTASAIWRMRSITDEHRARAAYLIASAYDARRDWSRCWRWLDSAIALHPEGRGYRDLRDKCRGLSG